MSRDLDSGLASSPDNRDAATCTVEILLKHWSITRQLLDTLGVSMAPSTSDVYDRRTSYWAEYFCSLARHGTIAACAQFAAILLIVAFSTAAQAKANSCEQVAKEFPSGLPGNSTQAADYLLPCDAADGQHYETFRAYLFLPKIPADNGYRPPGPEVTGYGPGTEPCLGRPKETCLRKDRLGTHIFNGISPDLRCHADWNSACDRHTTYTAPAGWQNCRLVFDQNGGGEFSVTYGPAGWYANDKNSPPRFKQYVIHVHAKGNQQLANRIDAHADVTDVQLVALPESFNNERREHFGCDMRGPVEPVNPPSTQPKSNPLFAAGGCVFPNGTRVAYFPNLPIGDQYITVGAKISIVVLNGNPATYQCIGGSSVTRGDLSMTVTQTDRQTNNPFSKLTVTGMR